MGWEPLPSDRVTTHRLSESLARLQRSLGLARVDTLRTLEASWPALVGRHLAAHCRLESLREARLVVVTEDPAVAEHLRWQVRDLVDAANDLVGAGTVSEVVVRVRRPR
jgi:predicted nucleic acid-binding Zn ribbon protein